MNLLSRAVARCIIHSRLPRPLPARDVLIARTSLPLQLNRFASAVSVTLRPYQEDCINQCLAALADGMHRIGVSLPTGSGKTTIFASLISKIPQRGANGTKVLVLVGTVELAKQAADRIKSMHPNMTVDIEQGSLNVATGDADCTVATYQTLLSGDRLSKFDPAKFKCIFVDEAHHAASPAYLRILSRFDSRIQPPEQAKAGIDEETGELVEEPSTEEEAGKVPIVLAQENTSDQDRIAIMGFSATFSRHDGLALNSVFDHIVYHVDFVNMIEQGWLIPVRFTTVHLDVDLEKIAGSRTTGDFVARSLSQVVNQPEINKVVFDSWKLHAHDRKATLVFAVDIAHVDSLTETFQEQGVEAKALTGKTPPKERANILDGYKRGEFPVLINCAILTEGADVPLIDCVLLARPTMSQNLFAQMIGRGLRLSPATDKKDCLIIDLVGNTQRGLVSAPSLFGLDPQTPVNNASVADLKEQISQAVDQVDPVSLSTDLDDISVHYQHPSMQSLLQGQNMSVYRISPNAWIHCGNNVFVLSLLQLGYIRVEKEKDGLWSSQLCRRLPNSHRTARAAMVSEDIGDFSRCIRICDTVAARYMTAIQRGTGALLRSATWRNAPATPQQQSTLRKMVGDSLERLLAVAGLAPKSGPALSFSTLTKGQAGALFILCQHGARGRVLKAAKADEALVKRKTTSKKVGPKVTVGPLPRQPELRP